MDEREVIKKEELLTRVSGKMDLLKEIIAIFLRDYPDKLRDIRQAIADQNAGELDDSAHALKGLAGNFSAYRVVDAAFSLEMMGRNADLSQAEETYHVLEKELELLKAALGEFTG
ncbi:MAG: Hpt domain-containing protein [Candidatus Schekmanbacteria bacterium]|nr:Hpt domain-containing protein [Candidatus Schekmanbacteria bacterium]